MTLINSFGEVIDITGSAENTYGSLEMVEMLNSYHPHIVNNISREIKYEFRESPPDPDYQSLWIFLRSGGFSQDTNKILEILGRSPRLFTDYVKNISL